MIENPKRSLSRIVIIATGFVVLGEFAVLGFLAPRVWLFIILIVAVFAACLILSSYSSKTMAKTDAAQRIYRLRRPEAGTWLEAPIAEIDKSTTGKLLANRMAREPGLHVVVRGRGSAPEPVRSDVLYDEQLDG